MTIIARQIARIPGGIHVVFRDGCSFELYPLTDSSQRIIGLGHMQFMNAAGQLAAAYKGYDVRQPFALPEVAHKPDYRQQDLANYLEAAKDRIFHVIAASRRSGEDNPELEHFWDVIAAVDYDWRLLSQGQASTGGSIEDVLRKAQILAHAGRINQREQAKNLASLRSALAVKRT